MNFVPVKPAYSRMKVFSEISAGRAARLTGWGGKNDAISNYTVEVLSYQAV